MSKIKRDQIGLHLIEKQFNYIEKTVLDAIFDKTWKESWELTQEQHEKWKKYCIFTMKKVLKINKTKATETFEWLNKTYGLKVNQK